MTCLLKKAIDLVDLIFSTPCPIVGANYHSSTREYLIGDGVSDQENDGAQDMGLDRFKTRIA